MDDKRLDILEHRVNKLDDELSETKILLAKTETLTQQSIETTKQLSTTLDSVKETMIRISDSIDMSNRNSQRLSENIE
jgi:chromosome segregation ATPase